MEWLVSVFVVAAVFITLWRPASAVATPTSKQDRRISALTLVLGEPHASAAAIDEHLRRASRFQPDPQASRALAEALAVCDTAMLDDSARIELARRLYAITTGDDLESAQRSALHDIQQTLVATHCSPEATDAVMNAAWKVARTDPNRRRDWW